MKTEQNQKTTWLWMARLGVVLMGMLPGVLCAEDTTTAVVDNVVSNFTGIYYLGNSGINNTLDIINGGVLNASTTVNIGYGVAAHYNRATVTGSGSSLNVPNSYLVCGSRGDWNEVLVEAGGTLKTLYGSIGHQADGASNRVTITGVGSLWTNSYAKVFYVGNVGVGNELIISNQGACAINGVNVGFAAAASNNRVLVTGANSILNVFGNSLVCGTSGDSNAVVVEAGGTLRSQYGSIGDQLGADGNRVTITGAGSLWTNLISGGFYVGNGGAGNELIVSNQGSCVINGGYVGYTSTAEDNHVLVTGANSVWKNTATVINSIGYRGRACTLTVRDGGLVDFTGSCAIGDQIGADDCQVIVTDSNSMLQTPVDVVAGQYSSRNSLMVTNGGVVSCRQWMIGNGSNSVHNVATVGGNGACVDTAIGYGVYVGNNGPSNTLHVLSGGTVTSGANLVIGNSANSIGNLLRVAGGTLVVTNAAATEAIELRRGTMELDGAGGIVTANRLYINQGQGVLRFRASASGVTPLTVTGAITIDQSLASLEVDVSKLQLTSSPMVVTLVNYGTLNLPFTDVTVIGHQSTVTQTGGQIKVKVVPIGTLLSIR